MDSPYITGVHIERVQFRLDAFWVELLQANSFEYKNEILEKTEECFPVPWFGERIRDEVRALIFWTLLRKNSCEAIVFDFRLL